MSSVKLRGFTNDGFTIDRVPKKELCDTTLGTPVPNNSRFGLRVQPITKLQ